MTLPNTEELQRLLRRTTPGPWEIIREPYGDAGAGHQVTVQVGPFEHVEDDGQHFICSGWDEDTDLAALAPELAAEVIRLRKAIEAEANVSHTRADKCDAKFSFERASWHREKAMWLTRILEGDQE